MESGAISNEQIDASSYLPSRNPEFARIRSEGSPLEGGLSWSPKEDDERPYLEISFPELTEITAIATQGGEDGNYVRRYTVEYADAEGEKSIIEEVMTVNGELERHPVVFTGKINL